MHEYFYPDCLKQKQLAEFQHNEIKRENLLIGLTKDNNAKIKLDVEIKIKDRPQKNFIDLKDVDFPLCLSISGNIGSHSGGQNYEKIQNLIADDTIKYKNGWDKTKLSRIIEIWKRYHLNDMKAATGSSWLYKPLPDNVIKEVHSIINSLNDKDSSFNDMIINEEFTNKLNYEIEPIGLTKSPWNKDQSVKRYEVTLTFETRQMTLPFYAGLGHSGVDIFDILECLQSDCFIYQNSGNIDDFAAEMGIEKPSEAIKQFKAVEKQYNELKELFNDNFDLFLNSDIS